jgi:hypothetical protein
LASKIYLRKFYYNFLGFGKTSFSRDESHVITSKLFAKTCPKLENLIGKLLYKENG